VATNGYKKEKRLNAERQRQGVNPTNGRSSSVCELGSSLREGRAQNDARFGFYRQLYVPYTLGSQAHN
jgi:hypothetical protein